MLPLGGMFISLFAAWGLPKTVIGSQLGLQEGWVNVVWKLLCGVIAPLGVLAVFVGTFVG
jgi:SNF family Na+-dependent transporter